MLGNTPLAFHHLTYQRRDRENPFRKLNLARLGPRYIKDIVDVMKKQLPRSFYDFKVFTILWRLLIEI